MNKAEELKKLETEIAGDESLPLREANLVFGEGNIDCQVLFIGEAPGFHENEQRRPFVGRAGQLLNKLIGDIGWKREDVYITNIIKRRPPENRDPLPEEIEAYQSYLTRQIEIINPKLIVTLGRFSMNCFLPTAKITRDQGKLFKWAKGDEGGFRYLTPMFHPAAALRSTQNLEALEAGFKKLPDMVKKCESIANESLAVSMHQDKPEVSQGGLF